MIKSNTGSNDMSQPAKGKGRASFAPKGPKLSVEGQKARMKATYQTPLRGKPSSISNKGGSMEY